VVIHIKILIVGIVACGKTTLAKKIYLENNIKYFELDSIVHDDYSNRKRNNNEQQDILKKINKDNDDWIIEGTLRKNLYNLLHTASKIIYIDIPLHTRKKRILWRFLKQKLGMEKSNYKPTLKMLKTMYKWTKDFEENKKNFEKVLKKYNKKLIILDTVSKVENYTLKLK